MSTPSFGSYTNPISTRGADYANPILVSTPSFESHRRACEVIEAIEVEVIEAPEVLRPGKS